MRLLLFGLFIWGCFYSFGKGIRLSEVNSEWEKQRLSFATINVPENEAVRIHLRLVEGFLRGKTTSELGPELKKARLRYLDRLRGYWENGVFPRNYFCKKRISVFKDIEGRLCAVGFLVASDGETEVVDMINNQNTGFER